MFRASLRSVSDPVRDNVCFSCLARRFGAPTRLRQFHAQAALRAETGDGQLGNRSEDASVTPPKPTEVRCLQSCASYSGIEKSGETNMPSAQVPSPTEQSHPESPSEGDNPGLSSSSPPKKSKKARKKDAARKSSEQEHGEHNAKKKTGRTSPKAGSDKTPGVGKNVRARGYAIKLPPSIKGSSSTRGSPSIKTVTQMLEERAKKAEQQKQAAEKPKQPSAEKGKLTHIASFVREKNTGSIHSGEQKVTGKYLEFPRTTLDAI